MADVKKLIALVLVAGILAATGIGCGGSSPSTVKTTSTTEKKTP